MVNETDRRLLTSMYRFRRSCVRVRESTLLVALSRTGLARGRLLLDRHRRPTAKSTTTRQRLACGKDQPDSEGRCAFYSPAEFYSGSLKTFTELAGGSRLHQSRHP